MGTKFVVAVVMVTVGLCHQIHAQQHIDVTMCTAGFLYDGFYGSIYSPGYPGYYESSTDCNLQVQQYEGPDYLQVLELTAREFAIEQQYDHLYVYFGDVGQVDDFDGSSDEGDPNAMPVGETLYYNSTTGALRLRFYADSSATDTGFKIDYRVTAYPATEPSPTAEIPGPTSPPTIDGRCDSLGGLYQSIDGTADLVIREDKDTQDTNFEVTGLYRNNSDPVSLWIQYLGIYDPRPFKQLMSFSGFLGAGIWTLNGVCKECEDGVYLDMFQSTINVKDPECWNTGSATPTTYARFRKIQTSKESNIDLNKSIGSIGESKSSDKHTKASLKEIIQKSVPGK